MNKGKSAYWISTGLLCLMYGMSAVTYIMQRTEVEQGFLQFGYPAYLVTVLIVVKIAAVMAVLSRVSVRLSDLAYAGMLFHLLLALSAHLSVSDGGFGPATFGLVLLTTSFLMQNHARKVPSSNVPPVFATRQAA